MESWNYGDLYEMKTNADGLVFSFSRVRLQINSRLTEVSLPQVGRFQRPGNFIYLSSGEQDTISCLVII